MRIINMQPSDSLIFMLRAQTQHQFDLMTVVIIAAILLSIILAVTLINVVEFKR